MDVDTSGIIPARNDELKQLDNAANQRLQEEEEEFHSAYINEKLEEEKKFKALFVDKNGKSFDPSSKFGVI